MWQSQVEIEHYSVVYLVTLPGVTQYVHYRWGSYALCTLMNTHLHLSSTPNRSSVLQRFESGNAFEIGDGIMFDFYPELPHIE